MPSQPVDLLSQLRTTLGKMEAALGTISEGIVWANTAGSIQWCNAAFSQLVEKKSIEVLGTSLMSLLPLEEQGRPLPSGEHPLELALKTRSTVQKAYGYRTSGRRLVLEVSATFAQLGTHDESVVLVLRDATELTRMAELEKDKVRLEAEMAERKRGEEALREKNRELEHQMKIMIGREGRVIELKREVNALLEELGRPRKYTV